MKKPMLALLAAAGLGFAFAADEKPLTVVVMDPLALPLSCPCVQGYAQRDYEQLARFLEKQLGRPVKVHFSESLVKALKKDTDGKADLVIGKYSVVVADARAAGKRLTPALALTGKDGLTVQTGLIVVPATDEAQTVADLRGYRIFFGPSECEEKHGAALDLLKTFGVPAPGQLETCEGCDVGARKALDLAPKEKAAAVISSYAHPLLEGCATVPKGSLRIVGTTTPVRFVTAFLNEDLSPSDKDAVVRALRAVDGQPALKTSLETKNGFVPFDAAADGQKKR